MISIIAAIDKKRGLGKNNQMSWNIPGELRRFKEITTPHPIIMGRKTFESIGRILPNRYNIVITKNKEFKINDLRFGENFIVVDSLEQAIEKALRQAQGKQNEEIFIIGGGQIFKEAIDKNLVDKLYLTLVDKKFDCDTFFPDFSKFKIVKEQNSESEEYKYSFLELVRELT